MTTKERKALFDQLLQARQEELEKKKCHEHFTRKEWEERREEQIQEALCHYREKVEDRTDDELFGDELVDIAGEVIEGNLEAYQSQLEDMNDKELEDVAAASARRVVEG